MRRFLSPLKFCHTPAVQTLCDSRNSGAGTISCLQVSPLGRLNFKNRTNRPFILSSLPRSRSFTICNNQPDTLVPLTPGYKRNTADARPQCLVLLGRMSIGNPFNAIDKLGQTKVNDKSSLQFLESQICEALCSIDGVASTSLTFNDHGVINEDVNAERMLWIAQVLSLVDNWTRCFKLRPVSMCLKFVGKRALIDLFEYAGSTKRLVDFNGTRDDVLGNGAPRQAWQNS